MSPAPVRVLCVDDDATIRSAMVGLIAAAEGFEMAGEARTGAEAVEVCATVQPDVVLMDLEMPVMSGVEATRRITRRWPGVTVVAVTAFGTREYVVAALRAGAAGYLVKSATGPALLHAIRQAVAGDMPLSSVVRRQLVATIAPEDADDEHLDPGLTDREVETVGLVAHGLTNAQIAKRMFVGETTVKQYVHRASEKLGVSSRTQLLVRSIQLGIVDPRALPPLG